jgi:pimeloyl-ACP methyl ester carboxylesterase
MPHERQPGLVAKRPRTSPRFMTRGRLAISALVVLVMVLLLTAGNTGTAAGRSEPSVGQARFNPSFYHGNVAIDGGTIHYVRGGSGPPIVLLHGWPQNWWVWRLVMPELARDHTVIAMDLPGLGRSSIPDSGYDKVTTAGRIRQAVHRLGFSQVEILAHDVGVTVAYPYARDYPNEVTRLAVLDAPLPGVGLEDLLAGTWHFNFNAHPAPLAEDLVDNSDVKTYHSYIFDFSFHREAVDRETYFRAYSDPARRTAGYKYYRAIPTDSADNQAKAVSKRLPMPVLAMGGAFSLGPQVAVWFRKVAGDVRTVVAPDSGHFIPEENPRFVIDCTRLFFGHGASNGQPVPPELAGCTP